jgi:hypothetical protein
LYFETIISHTFYCIKLLHVPTVPLTRIFCFLPCFWVMLLRVCLGACRTRSTAAGDVCHENVRQVADGVSLYGPCLNLQIIMLRIVATQPEGSLERTSSYRETSITILSISSGVRFRVHAHPLPLRLRYFVVLRLYCWKTAGAYSTPCRMFRAGGGAVRGGERRPGVHRRGHKTESKCSSRLGPLISVFRSMYLD